ncbi:GEVED domain-containing protein [Flavobacterium saliperosum]|uniref:Ig-like domain-containing protein n=2 Tax=Flavobacterium saliperosum TaxID=329186 RepID=A0A1G4V4P3_9FLAO|nr:hypothetical protein SAMN02927925_00277 [Flavobacterium saliperosum]
MKNYPNDMILLRNCFQKITTLILLFLINHFSYAQTNVFPVTDGAFETGTTFAANGWSAVNGSNTARVWQVGTGQVGYNGARSAFIGSSATTITGTQARLVHFYRSITIPAGATNIQLSFTYKQAISDYASGTYYDYIAAYTDGAAPTAGTLPPVGSRVFGPYPNANITTYTAQNVTLSNTLAGTTTNLIFTFECDNQNPHGYGAVDDIILTYTPAPVPTITSLGTTSGCVGDSITINGTGLTGATAANVKIGGTAVTSITSNTGTQIIAVIGAGTTGTVEVTTPGGSATSAATFTVNPLPANPGNPTSNSPQCFASGVTLTRVGAPPAGVTWFWQTTALGTSTANSGNTYNVTTSGTYYIRAQNNTTGCWSSGFGSTTVTVNNIPAITTNPANSSITVGSNTSFTVVASNTPTSYVWEVSTNGGGSWSTVTNGGVYSGATTATLTITAAPIGMDGYQYRARATNACGSSANSTTATLNITLAYCTPSFTTIVEPISNVNFNTINNNSANTCGAGTSYENFTAVSTNAFRGFTYTLSVTSNTCGNWTDYVYAYFDWNRDGDFADAGESYNLGTINNTTAGVLTQSISIPMGASLGATRMRIIKNFASAPTDPCRTGAGYGQAEDYTVNIIAPPACTTPTAQPTAMSLTPAGTSIAGSFTAASPASDSYLVVVSTFATPPASPPVNGTTYAIGSSVSSGYIVVDNDSNTSFTAGGLANNTTYYFYIYSFNGLCTGGPLYYTTGPLTGNATTTAVVPTYCTPSSTNNNVYISSMRSVGTIIDASNGPTGYSAGGYANYTGTTIATQIPGGGINMEIIVSGSYQSGPCNTTSQFIKTWVDWNKDGDFDDAGEQVYVSGTDLAPVATALDNIYGFVVPAGTFPGNYRMRIRTRAYCDSGTVTPCGSHTTGETEDYTITIVEDCPSKITSVTGGSACGPTNTVTLNATKTASATGFRWYTTLSGGAPIATTAAGTWTTPSIGVTTTYYVTAYDGVCETIHRTPVVATILPTSNITVTPSVPEVCGENNVVQISATGDFVTETLLLQTFESGMAPFTVTTPTNTNGGADSPWSVKTSPYVPNSTTVWRPALNSGAIGTVGNSFAFTTSDYSNSTLETIMTSPSIDASLFTSLTLTYNHIYGAFSGDTGRLEVSVAGGPFTAVERTYTTTDIGTPSVFATETVNFTAYAGQSNLRFRFRYNAQWDDGWAIDNIKLEGVKPLNTTFTWTGGTVNAFIDAGLTTPYVAQSVSTVYVVPDAGQLASPSWSFTANATLGNGCPVSKLITIDNKTKLWVGSTSNDWQNPNNWSPVGVPDANTCVIIYDGPFDSNVLSAVPAFAKTLIVRPNGDLQIHPNNSVTVTDVVTVDTGGIFNIRNTGSLVQINNVANSGIINMERISQPMYLYDYTYWNSPVTAASGFTLGNLTTATSHIFNYTPTQAGANGIWTQQSAGTVMSPTRGYIARAPLSFPTSGVKQTKTVNFIGTPNNGNILMPISKGTNANIGSTLPSGGSTVVTDADDEWNLIGNPYPSAIDIVPFLNHPTNTPVVDGTVYLWTHNTPPTAATPDPFYGNYALNYTVNDYATVNLSGATATATSGGTAPSRYIAAGQSFFISADNAMANGTTANVLFNNSMRVSNENNHFLRTENEAQAPEGFEAKRLWLNLSNNAGGFSQILVGYITGATLDWDRGFDGESLAGNAVKFYSLGADTKLTIQARPWPFVEDDIVPLGFKATSQNNYTIGIDHLDADFNSQNIYLEDKLLNIIHDLKSAPYSFTSEAGVFDTRFVLRYTQNTLSNEEVTAFENTVTIFTNSKLNAKSTIEPIKEIIVYDLLGRVLTNVVKVNANEFTVSNLNPTESTLIVKVTLENNVVITKKVIY